MSVVACPSSGRSRGPRRPRARRTSDMAPTTSASATRSAPARRRARPAARPARADRRPDEAWNTSTATRAASAFCARLKAALTGAWRCCPTSTTPAPRSCAPTSPAGDTRKRPAHQRHVAERDRVRLAAERQVDAEQLRQRERRDEHPPRHVEPRVHDRRAAQRDRAGARRPPPRSARRTARRAGGRARGPAGRRARASRGAARIWDTSCDESADPAVCVSAAHPDPGDPYHPFAARLAPNAQRRGAPGRSSRRAAALKPRGLAPAGARPERARPALRERRVAPRAGRPAAPDQPRPDQPRPDQPRPDQPRPDQPRPSQARPPRSWWSTSRRAARGRTRRRRARRCRRCAAAARSALASGRAEDVELAAQLDAAVDEVRPCRARGPRSRPRRSTTAGRPWSQGVPARRMRQAELALALLDVRLVPQLLAAWRSSSLIWSGVAVGRCCSSRAAAPETTAAACDVPLPRMKRSPSAAIDAYCSSIVEPGTRRLAMRAPKATTSGLRLVSSVMSPRLEKDATASSVNTSVPRVSAAPTATTNGSRAGVVRPGLSRLPGRARRRCPRHDDHDAGLPGGLDGVRQGADLARLHGVGAVGEVQHADVQAVVAAVGDDPVDRGDDLRDVDGAVASPALTETMRASGATPRNRSGRFTYCCGASGASVSRPATMPASACRGRSCRGSGARAPASRTTRRRRARPCRARRGRRPAPCRCR